MNILGLCFSFFFFYGGGIFQPLLLNFSVIVQWLDVMLKPTYMNQRYARHCNQKFVIIVVIKSRIS